MSRERQEKEMKRGQAYTLYLCHTLSTWNARVYEFAAILFTAAAYPGGLRAASFVGITISLAAICFASALGRWIDQAPSRLRTLLTTIVVNRCAIFCSCLGWFLIVGGPKTKLRIRDGNTNEASDETDAALHGMAKTITFIAVLVLGVFENLARKANMISIERDWVPVLAPETGPIRFTLTQVNSIMARIDIVCKLIAPIAVSGFISVVPSVRIGVVALAATNLISLAPEIWSAKLLWDHISAWWNGYIPSLKLFFSTEVWIPSMAMSMLHSSVLSVTGIVIVFLLNSGYSLKVVTLAEAASSAFEIGSTFLAPVAVRKLSLTTLTRSHGLMNISHQDEEILSDTDSDIDADDPLHKNNFTPDVNVGIIRLGLWGVFGMLLTLAPTLPLLYQLTHMLAYPIPPNSSSPTLYSHPLLTIFLLILLSASRLGRGLFSLSTQQLAQARVPAHHRSSYAGTEIAFVSLFGLSHHVGGAIWSHPEQFSWLALGSVGAVGASSLMYGWWARSERGHLIHRNRLSMWRGQSIG
ncbi:hypothetical protein AOQ84DRAFT_347778 [Glonium stellatum]|uniref:Solute carrier family 40 member n=1 Tax=Glonium stellatum TaxID=574774 RepID=A0A8E2ER73_9PEZI|nr:hypothetical protein AOQ84DRAFT_347778 [Glonium stellatum]